MAYHDTGRRQVRIHRLTSFMSPTFQSVPCLQDLPEPSQSRPFIRARHPHGMKIPRAKLCHNHTYRTPAGAVYPSVTTILSATKPRDAADGLEAWRARVGGGVADHIMRESADIGTQTHMLNESYLNRTPYTNTRLLARAHHENFIPYLDRITRVYGTEQPLYSDHMKVAGTADCIAEYGGQTSIIDYKTKRKPQQPGWITDYHIQTAAYAMMFTDMTGMHIQQCVILVSSECDTMQEFISDPRKHSADFLARLHKYDAKIRPGP